MKFENAVSCLQRELSSVNEYLSMENNKIINTQHSIKRSKETVIELASKKAELIAAIKKLGG